jgi:hypothetical protein
MGTGYLGQKRDALQSLGLEHGHDRLDDDVIVHAQRWILQDGQKRIDRDFLIEVIRC